MSGVLGLGSSLLWAVAIAPPPDLSIFEPASPGAQSIVSLALLVLAVAALIFLVVEGILFYSRSAGFATRADPSDTASRRAAAGLRQPPDRNRLDRGAHGDRVLPGAGHRAHAVGSQRRARPRTVGRKLATRST